MEPVSPVIPGQLNIPEHEIAKKQPEYETLPAICVNPDNHTFLSRWKLSPEEIEIIRQTGDLYIFVTTFGDRIQPMLLQVERPASGDVIHPMIEADESGKEVALDEYIGQYNESIQGRIKIFHRVNGSEYYAGKDIDDARLACAAFFMASDPDHKIDHAKMDRIQFIEIDDPDLDRIIFTGNTSPITFRLRLKWMMSEGWMFPRMFASDKNVQS